MKPSIEILPSHEIDSFKWNQKVTLSNDGLIYAQTDYLNRITEKWSGVIINDYESIFPIPHRNKWGIEYAYTPPFIQQLGLIGSSDTTIISSLKMQILKKFKYGSFLLNASNNAIAKDTGAIPRPNLFLPLQQPFSVLEKSFKKEISKISEKRICENWIYNTSINVQDCVYLYQQIHGHKMVHISVNDYEQLIRFCAENKNPNLQYHSRSVHNPAGELCSVIVLLRDDKRIYNIINATTPEGKKAYSNYLLYYECLKEFSQQSLLFDFEGSSIPGVAEFYAKFNPHKEYYYLWHYNCLPFPLSLIR